MNRLPKRATYVAVALGLLALLIWAFVPAPVEVDVAPVQRGLLRVTVDEEGKTRIRERYVITAPLAGQLQRMTLDPGDPVIAGQTVLAKIVPNDPALLDPRARAEAEARVDAAAARLKQVEPEVAKAQAELEIAQSDYKRFLEMEHTGGASRKEIDDAMLLARARTEALRSINIARDIARYELQVAQATLQRSFQSTTAPSDSHIELIAPVSGKVLRIIRESSMPVTAGTEIIEIGDPQNLEVDMEVLSTEAVQVEPGDRVLFVRWGGNEALEGVVRLVEPQAFTKISALGVEEQRVHIISDITSAAEDYRSLGDAFRVDGRIIVWEDSDALIVPTSAMFRNEDQWRVFAVEDDRAQARDITVGRTTGLAAQVLDGVKETEIVIVHPSDRVTPGVRVRRRSSG